MILAAAGASAFWFIIVWLVCAAVAGYVADRKGYPEHWGLASGLVLLPLGVLLWLLIPGRANSAWKREGMFPKRRPPREAIGAARPAADREPGADLTKPSG